VKYGLEGGNWIGVSAEEISEGAGRLVEIRVADRGPGIPAAEQARLFDAFYRGESAVQDQVHGTGLGLNIAKSIIEAHGGTIRVSSELRKGAEFVVRIPAAPEELQDACANTTG
jgi:signal transduction histidine kinase